MLSQSCGVPLCLVLSAQRAGFLHCETESTLLVVVCVDPLNVVDDVVQEVCVAYRGLRSCVGELGEVHVEVVVGRLVVKVHTQLVVRDTILLLNGFLKKKGYIVLHQQLHITAKYYTRKEY